MDLASLAPQATQYLIAFGLALSRMLGVMTVTPAFNRLGMTRVLQGGVGLAFSIPLAPMIAGALMSEPLTAQHAAALLLKEAVAGVVIGLVMGAPFWAAELAGGVLDVQRGSSMANLSDPAGMDESSVLGTWFVVALLALFFSSGGLILLMGVIYDSYAIWPPGQMLPMLGPNAGVLFLGLLDKVFIMGLLLGAPLIVAALLSDLALALVSRAAPNLHVFDLSLSVKSLVISVLLVLYSAFMFNYMGGNMATSLLDGKAQIEAISGAPKNP